jgi:transposase
MRSQLGQIYRDEDFADLYARQGQPGWSAWRLAMVCVMQFMEDLTNEPRSQQRTVDVSC